MVRARCDVYCREERRTVNEEAMIDVSWTVCAYCGRSELVFKDEPEPEQPDQPNAYALASHRRNRRKAARGSPRDAARPRGGLRPYSTNGFTPKRLTITAMTQHRIIR